MRLKVDLPNYGVFDEKRVFALVRMPGPGRISVACGIGVADLRGHLDGGGAYEDVVEMPGRNRGRTAARCRTARPTRATRTRFGSTSRSRASPRRDLPLIYVNQVGGQDELVFDGASFGCTPIARSRSAPGFCEEVVDTLVWERARQRLALRRRSGRGGWRRATRRIIVACMLGLRDYVNKNGFKGVVFGLSGGVDSALVAALAVDALGAERVRCVMLPYRFTSQESLDDAARVA